MLKEASKMDDGMPPNLEYVSEEALQNEKTNQTSTDKQKEWLNKIVAENSNNTGTEVNQLQNLLKVEEKTV